MRRLSWVPLALTAMFAGGAVRIVQDQCGPFTDVTPAFCPFVSELYYLGITAGTSATTFSPDDPLTRGQAAVFVAKGLNQSLARSSRRAALGQWWTTQDAQAIGSTTVPDSPQLIAFDGADLWIAHAASGSTVASRVRASDGKLLETWTTMGNGGAVGVLVAMGRVFLTAQPGESQLLMIDPTQPPGAATLVSNQVGSFPTGIAFDGSRIWTANNGYPPSAAPPSVSIVTPAAAPPWPATTVTAGFSRPYGALFDGTSVWVTDGAAPASGSLLRLASDGSIAQIVPVGMTPLTAVFDGANIWVPNAGSNTVTVVRASTGAVVATLSGNGLTVPFTAAFDGERILVTNAAGSSVSLWRAADLTPIGTFVTPPNPFGVCSDGKDFWITFQNPAQLGRF